MALIGRVATEGEGVDAFGSEVGGHLGGFFALVDEDEDAFEIDAFGRELVVAAGYGWGSGGGVCEDVLGGGFADGPDGVGARERFVAAVGLLFYVDDAELDAARDGVQFWGGEAAHVREAVAEVGVEASGDGGGAED